MGGIVSGDLPRPKTPVPRGNLQTSGKPQDLSPIKDRITLSGTYKKEQGKSQPDPGKFPRLTIRGKTLLSFEEARQKNPSLTTAQYLRQFKECVRTREDFFNFERTFRGYLTKLPAGLVRKIRRHGLKVTGIQSQVTEMKQRFGVKVVTEYGPRSLFVVVPRMVQGMPKTKAIPLSLVAQRLSHLQRKFEFYPPGFLQGGGLKRVFIRGVDAKGQLMEHNHSGTIIRYKVKLGGEAHEDGVMLLYPDSNEYTGSFDHEVYHIWDYKDGGYRDDNQSWGREVRGPGYERLYGKSGLDVLRSKKVGGKAPKGFASQYGRAGGIDEDQAETARLLLLSSKSCRQLMQRSKKEPALKKAIAKIKADYYRWSQGRMDQTFWQDFANGVRIDQNYWRARIQRGDFRRPRKPSVVSRLLTRVSRLTGLKPPK